MGCSASVLERRVRGGEKSKSFTRSGSLCPPEPPPRGSRRVQSRAKVESALGKCSCFLKRSLACAPSKRTRLPLTPKAAPQTRGQALGGAAASRRAGPRRVAQPWLSSRAKGPAESTGTEQGGHRPRLLELPRNPPRHFPVLRNVRHLHSPGSRGERMFAA